MVFAFFSPQTNLCPNSGSEAYCKTLFRLCLIYDVEMSMFLLPSAWKVLNTFLTHGKYSVSGSYYSNL